MLRDIEKVHFVGIGGIGVSGLAEILLNLGYRVSGSDLKSSNITDRLERLGATVYEGHVADHIEDAAIVVISAAVPDDNPEVVAARERGIPVVQRSQMLADLMRLKPSAIAVAGTHGKTTASSMIAAVLEQAEMESTAIIGGILNRTNSNVAWGRGDLLVAEADEHDGSFLRLFPTNCVVTNIDPEHLDYYGTLDAIKLAFLDFINRIPFYGFAVLCSDDRNVRDLLPEVQSTRITYGLGSDAEVRAENIQVCVPNPPGSHPVSVIDEVTTCFSVVNNRKNLAPLGTLGDLSVRAVGDHNVRNALAAVTTGLALGMTFEQVREGLASFRGVRRRLQVKGRSDGIVVLEDYAHHPTEIAATLDAVRAVKPGRIIAVFQPHLYSRTKYFCSEFADVLLDTDRLIVTEIYRAREKPMPGVTALDIVRMARDMGHGAADYVADKNEVIDIIEREGLETGDVVLFLGAGDIWRVTDEMARRIESPQNHDIEET
ncbi:MAG: UDP-N-acetylmuramate--L-alanine ligase [Candidatus Hydrogenedentes bacterium]|nr:UDP-N-acetylmuramate--L-alanine ligase [Candidatus Hydrogenedentota bacterium]